MHFRVGSDSELSVPQVDLSLVLLLSLPILHRLARDEMV